MELLKILFLAGCACVVFGQSSPRIASHRRHLGGGLGRPHMGMRKPGRCPRFTLAGIRRHGCINMCLSDFQCPGLQKCCNRGCQRICVRPIGGGRRKPAICPRPALFGAGFRSGFRAGSGAWSGARIGGGRGTWSGAWPPTCAVLCRSDFGCPRRQKCCSNGCGLECMRPRRRGDVRPGRCPVRVLPGSCVQRCFSDFNCPRRQKCCSNGCGRECTYPVFRGRGGVFPFAMSAAVDSVDAPVAVDPAQPVEVPATIIDIARPDCSFIECGFADCDDKITLPGDCCDTCPDTLNS